MAPKLIEKSSQLSPAEPVRSKQEALPTNRQRSAVGQLSVACSFSSSRWSRYKTLHPSHLLTLGLQHFRRHHMDRKPVIREGLYVRLIAIRNVPERGDRKA